jgi:hypothetical protein
LTVKSYYYGYYGCAFDFLFQNPYKSAGYKEFGNMEPWLLESFVISIQFKY